MDSIADEAVSLALALPNTFDRQKVLASLSVELANRFELTGQLEDLSGSIKASKEAIGLGQAEDSQQAIWFTNLSVNLGRRYDRLGQQEDLEEAVRAAEEAVRLSHTEHPSRLFCLYNLSNNYGRRYTSYGRMEDLKNAICRAEEAVQIVAADDPMLALVINHLGRVLHVRYERTGELEDLQMAIRHAEKAVQLLPSDHAHLPQCLSELSGNLGLRYQRTGALEDIDQAIFREEQALQLTLDKDPQQAQQARYLNGLGNLLESRYERTGQLQDLEAAINKAEMASKLLPKGHPFRALYLSNLSNKFAMRYERTDRLEDLEEAISNVREAVQLPRIDEHGLATSLSNLGVQLRWRYERIGNMEDLEDAVAKARGAVHLTPPGHSDRAPMMSNLGLVLQRRYMSIGQTSDLIEAIDIEQIAVLLTPSDHASLAGRLINLSTKFQMLFDRTKQTEYLDEAIKKAERGVQATPSDHPDLAMYLNILGRQQYKSPNPLHHTRALDSFLRSWSCVNGIPSNRLPSAVAAINLLQDQQDWSRASEIANDAIRVLPIVNNRSLARDDQQHALSMFAGLAATACSLSVQAGRDVSEALEILELGRGAILGLLIDDRRDISQLLLSCPEEAKLYESLRAEVNVPAGDPLDAGGQQQKAKSRQDAVVNLEKCIHRIRAIPGHERFLLGATAQELQQQAKNGPVAIVNVTQLRADAILVSKSGINLVPLPDFSFQSIQGWIDLGLTNFTRSDYGKKNKLYRAFLAWIWKACVQVVLEKLADEPQTGVSKSHCRRMWWIGTGAACTIPFHAAGDHSPGSAQNTFSHAISSYTPTIKALDFARERIATTRVADMTVATATVNKKALAIVLMPETPGEADLPYVTGEASNIHTSAASAFSIQERSCPDADEVRERLQECHIFHYAGHGLSNPKDPSDGCLVLQKRAQPPSKPIQDRLTVGQISDMYLPHAHLAYLSACSTAENSATGLLDEVIHLVSGFQVAGFGHVIGSMWPSADGVCAEVARDFYAKLSQEDKMLSRDGSIAAALQAAVIKAKERYSGQPLLWAQYVHFGA
ncbi:uncharacterized protein A1O5_03478 [Cladophialophora psammophila CBS 110553]|uniref:CHAT domain-containing protein n=1 Tax=Cladophialophora psammophila CBS 110553 TaxID=1182543 RepID=W9X9V6_9EURO|nr:uncharacterized protein A1O5_03478 [Cladophialophora psammophila CBS 110553]EXJ73716.1 hypothetical protein A1O5_03478 [Cladophialophora psammophila CBS 110553]